MMTPAPGCPNPYKDHHANPEFARRAINGRRLKVYPCPCGHGWCVAAKRPVHA